LPTNAEPLLFDTSAALAFVDAENPFHRQTRELAIRRPRGLSGHAVFEFLSVLTRLPLPKRLHGDDAARLLRREFPDNRFLPPEAADSLIDEFAQVSIVGGLVYDGLVGACARHHNLTLVTCDRRAEATYRLLGTSYHLVGPVETR